MPEHSSTNIRTPWAKYCKPNDLIFKVMISVTNSRFYICDIYAKILFWTDEETKHPQQERSVGLQTFGIFLSLAN